VEKRNGMLPQRPRQGGFNVKRVNYHEELEKEREKLNRLAEEALKNGIPLTQDEAFMEQNLKVDALVVKVIKEEERHRKKQRER
jgi:hypothetical protein